MKKYIFIIKTFILIISTSSAFLIESKLPKLSRQNKRFKFINNFRMQNNNKNIQKNNAIISWTKEKGILLYDIPATPDIWTIAIVYFIQGLFSICGLALSFFYKDTLHLSPADLTIISSISSIPWIIKPFYGFISDTFPLFGYKRKSYIMISGLVATISWLFLANLSTLINNGNDINMIISTCSSVFLVTMSSLGLAFSDVIVDAIVVSKSRDQDKAGSLQSICWTFSSIGGIISAYFSGHLLQNYGTSFVFYLTAAIPTAMIATAGLIKEKKIEQENKSDIKIYNNENITEEKPFQLLKTQLGNIKNTLSKESIFYPLLFLIIWNVTPSAGSSLFYFEVNELGFTPEFFGKLGLASSISSLLGIVIYNKKLKNIPLRDIFKWSCLSGTILGLLPLMLVTHFNRTIGLPDTWFAMFDSVILSILGQITFMPVLVLAANICPPGVEGMLYATMMSANNLSGNIGRLFGGGLTKIMGITNSDFTNLPWLLLITNLSGLIPLMFLHYIPDERKKDIDNDKI